MSKIADSHLPYSALGLKDLLEARQAYHVQLSNLDNVVATAVGRYLIRVEDLAAAGRGRRRARAKGPRTLSNSEVRPWSWPCVLVFVRRWLEPAQLAGRPDDTIPRTLHLPDGRAVPVCIVYAGEAGPIEDDASRVTLPSQMVGGGYLAVADVQGRQRYASIGCLVSDGDRVFALTNRHVSGAAGRELGMILRGKYALIGRSIERDAGKVPFEDAYPGLPGQRAAVNVDAGLIELADVNGWTSQIVGLGTLRAPLNLHAGNLSLALIGAHVKAHGGASGLLAGEVRALFYRYRTMGGFDQMSDFLIGPRAGTGDSMPTRPGDSGTLWMLDKQPPVEEQYRNSRRQRGEPDADEALDMRPLALQWGGHSAIEGSANEQFDYALATSISTICRVLDVDVVREWNTGFPEYWGEVGHYTIGALATERARDSKLRSLLQKNADRISFDESTLADAKSADLDADADGFFPLADVPDTVWRMGTHVRPSDKGSHHADMDDAGSSAFPGQTLFDLCADPANVHPKVWNRYFDGLKPSPPPTKRGSLPFRVWQLFDLMVAAVKARDIAEYVGLAGVLSHYVGDACQPLHSSRFHDGDPDDLVEKIEDGKKKFVPRGSGVHSAYETAMLNRRGKALFEGVRDILGAKKADDGIQSGHAAALRAVNLMRTCQTVLPARTIVEFYITKSTAPTKLWAEFQDETTEVMAHGALLLASLWESAWRLGGGKSVPAAKIVEIKKSLLETKYRSKSFAHSFTLPELAKKTSMFKIP